MIKMILSGLMVVGLATVAQASSKQSYEALSKKCGPECSAKAKLQLSGTVTNFCAIKITPTPEATKLNISEGENETVVAKVNELSNSLNGYRVTVKSKNNGALVHSTVSTETVAYQLSYDGGALFSPTSSPQEVKSTGPIAAPADYYSDVRITFPANPAALAGTYTDTVVFEIATL